MSRIVLDSAAPRIPALRSGLTVGKVTAYQALALLPPLLVAVWIRGPEVVAVLVTALIAAIGWEIAVALLRHRSLSAHGVTTALIFAVLAPGEATIWQCALAVSFGAVIAELVFGGRGFGFVNAALAALAFLLFSFPGLTLDGGHLHVALAVLPGAAFLFWRGLLSWRVLLAMPAGLVLAGLAAGRLTDPVAAVSALAFVLVFIVADPLTGAITRPGRLVYGALAGALAVLFQTPTDAAPGTGALAFAALVAAIGAPLIDEILLRLGALIRERRNV